MTELRYQQVPEPKSGGETAARSVATLDTALAPSASAPSLSSELAGVAANTALRATHGGALSLAQALAHRALVESAYRLQRLGTAGLSGLALLVAAVVLFVANNLPQSSAVAALNIQLLQLAPLAQVTLPASPGGTVLAALPRRDDAPTVIGKIFAHAAAAGVTLARGQYEYVPARDGVAARYRMTFPVRTSYPKLRDFMDRTLVSLPAVAVEGLRIERKKVGDEDVEAELKLAAYVRSEP